MIRQFTAIVEREGPAYIAYCPGLGLKVIGTSITEAREKLAEAIEVFIDTASAEEIKRRQEVYVTQIELNDSREPATAGTDHSPAFLPGLRHGGTRYAAMALPFSRRRILT